MGDSLEDGMRDNCPNCGVNFVGGKVPNSSSDRYAGDYWRRDILIDGGYMGIYDGPVAIRCPDCKHEFPYDDSEFFLDLFKEYDSSKKTFP